MAIIALDCSDHGFLVNTDFNATPWSLVFQLSAKKYSSRGLITMRMRNVATAATCRTPPAPGTWGLQIKNAQWHVRAMMASSKKKLAMEKRRIVCRFFEYLLLLAIIAFIWMAMFLPLAMYYLAQVSQAHTVHDCIATSGTVYKLCRSSFVNHPLFSHNPSSLTHSRTV